MIWSIVREPVDLIAKTRISLGNVDLSKTQEGAYLVFRGEPEEVIRLLEESLSEARKSLPTGNYKDDRGRPQG